MLSAKRGTAALETGPVLRHLECLIHRSGDGGNRRVDPGDVLDHRDAGFRSDPGGTQLVWRSPKGAAEDLLILLCHPEVNRLFIRRGGPSGQLTGDPEDEVMLGFAAEEPSFRTREEQFRVVEADYL